jgi:hypothetical protein
VSTALPPISDGVTVLPVEYADPMIPEKVPVGWSSWVGTISGLLAPFLDAIVRSNTDAIDQSPQWLTWIYSMIAIGLMMWQRYKQARERQEGNAQLRIAQVRATTPTAVAAPLIKDPYDFAQRSYTTTTGVNAPPPTLHQYPRPTAHPDQGDDAPVDEFGRLTIHPTIPDIDEETYPGEDINPADDDPEDV